MTTVNGPREHLLAGTGISVLGIEAAGVATCVLECGGGDDLVFLHGPGEFAAGCAAPRWPRTPSIGSSQVPRSRQPAR